MPSLSRTRSRSVFWPKKWLFSEFSLTLLTRCRRLSIVATDENDTHRGTNDERHKHDGRIPR